MKLGPRGMRDLLRRRAGPGVPLHLIDQDHGGLPCALGAQAARSESAAALRVQSAQAEARASELANAAAQAHARVLAEIEQQTAAAFASAARTPARSTHFRSSSSFVSIVSASDSTGATQPIISCEPPKGHG